MNTDTTLALDPLVLPHAPSWLPLAWGWWATLATVVALALVIALVFRSRKNYRKAKRTALMLFDRPLVEHTPSSALELLRQAALCYYPRTTIAPLSGDAWYQFLDEQLGEACFVPKMHQWQAALYQPNGADDHHQLVADCRDWVAKALPPKRGDRA